MSTTLCTGKLKNSKRLHCRPDTDRSHADPMPNPVVGDSERDAGKSKKRNGLWKPKAERAPNRTSEIEFCGIAMPVVSRVGDSASSISGQ